MRRMQKFRPRACEPHAGRARECACVRASVCLCAHCYSSVLELPVGAAKLGASVGEDVVGAKVDGGEVMGLRKAIIQPTVWPSEKNKMPAPARVHLRGHSYE